MKNFGVFISKSARGLIIPAVILLSLIMAGCQPSSSDGDGKKYQLGKDPRLILGKKYCWMESTGSFAYVFRADSVVMIDVDAKTGAFSANNLVDEWHTKAGNLKFVRYGTERGKSGCYPVGWSFSYDINRNTLTLIDSRTWNTRTFQKFKLPN
jgi:hypothetical protein